MSWQPRAARTMPRRFLAFTSVTAIVLRLAEKPACSNEVAVTAPDSMSLTLQQLCQKGAGRSGPENEDPHGVAKTLSHTARQESRMSQEVAG